MAGDLWEDTVALLRDRLEDEPLTVEFGEDKVVALNDAFNVTMSKEPEEEVIVWAGEFWHEHFLEAEPATNCFCWLLTPYYRVIEDYSHDRLLEAFIERFHEGEWYEVSGGPIYLEFGEQAQANRRLVRQSGVLRRGEEYPHLAPWLDDEGLPPNTFIGIRELPIDRIVEVRKDTVEEGVLFDEDAIFGELFDRLRETEDAFDLVAGESWYEVRPHDPEGFAVRLERRGDQYGLMALDAERVGDAEEIAALAVMVLTGWLRVVEEFAGSARKSVRFQAYGPTGWMDEAESPTYLSFILRMRRTTERRYWQQRIEVGFRVAAPEDTAVDEDGFPTDSKWGCQTEKV